VASGLFELTGLVTGTSGGQTLTPNGGARREYQPTTYELIERRKIEREFEKAQLKLKTTENKIQTLEVKRARDLADEAMQIELLGLLTQQNELMQLIDKLQQQKLRIINDDDEVMLLLMRLIN
jgi:hypothetical protein